MEEKKPKKIIRKAADQAETTAPVKGGSTIGLRIGSAVLWAIAIACEVLCILLLNGTLYVPISLMAALIIGIVIDLICVVIAAMLWKKANRIKPMKKEGNKVGFYLWSQLGLIMAIACFLPLIVILLKNKDLDKKQSASSPWWRSSQWCLQARFPSITIPSPPKKRPVRRA